MSGPTPEPVPWDIGWLSATTPASRPLTAQDVGCYPHLMAEALPRLPPLTRSDLSDLLGGEELVGAADVVRMCADQGVRLSERALAEVEEEAEAFLDDDWRPWRDAAASILRDTARIRALDARAPRAA